MKIDLSGALAIAFAAGISLGTMHNVLAQETPASPRLTEQEALRNRIKTIELDRASSLVQFQGDKKACASTLLVSRCTKEALDRRRARDAVLRDAQVSAKEQLRASGAQEKNAELAANLARAELEASNQNKRDEAQNQRVKKLADAQERLEAHQQKKAQEAENRRLYLEKLKRAEDKQAEIRARFKASGTDPKASALATVPSGKGSVVSPAAPITSAN